MKLITIFEADGQLRISSTLPPLKVLEVLTQMTDAVKMKVIAAQVKALIEAERLVQPVSGVIVP